MQQTLLGGDGVTGETGATHNTKANANFTELYGATATAQAAADTANNNLSTHISDPTSAHAGSSISFDPSGTGLSSTDLQAALAELASAGGASDASETVKGIVELATVGEVITGTDTTRAVTPAGVAAKIGLKADVFVTQVTKTASFTLSSSELTQVNAGANVVMMMNVASGQNLEIPLDATVAFPVGTVIGIRQIGAGQTTITAVGGVTLNAPLNAFKLAAQNALAFIEKTATDTWYANGELVI